MGFLKEALNAEIVLGNITNYSEAFDWLNHTFFSIRLKRNPQNYGVFKEYGGDLDCDFLVEAKIN
jgi:activating signal cointegrator complex subunit 3